MNDVKIHWESLPRLWTAMETTGDQGVDIAQYFSAYVCSTSGINYDACALRPLGPAFESMRDWFWEMNHTFTERWNSMEDATSRTIKHIDEVDRGVHQDLARYTREIEIRNGEIVTYAEVDVADFHLDDLGDALEPPADGEDRLGGHDKDFMAVSEGYDGARDGINTIVDFVNRILPGDPLPSLPDRSLRDYLIYPLSGNYHRLQANATACRTVGTAMHVWAGNMATVAAKAPIAFDGRTGAAFASQLGLYATVMEGVRVAANGGSTVLDSIATMSERIAIRVERAVVILGKALLRLLKKLLSRLTSWLGWALTVADFITKGLDAFKDVARDVELVVHIITSLADLVDEVKAWAELQAKRLQDFKELVTAVEQLPPLTSLTTLRAAADADVIRVKKAVEAIKEDFGPRDPREDRTLLDRLDEVVKDAESRPQGSDRPAPPDPTPPRAPEPGEVEPAPRDPSPTPSPSAGPAPSAPSPSAPSPSASPSAPAAP